jgi:hypothetical protein
MLVQSASGVSTTDTPALLPLLPFRRVFTEQWLVPIARIGDGPAEQYPLAEETLIVSATGGPSSYSSTMPSEYGRTGRCSIGTATASRAWS